MFTGIVERTGKVVALTTPPTASGSVMTSITQLIVDAGKAYDTAIGDSVAVNGCCLTVTSNKMQLLAFDVSSETLAKTSLADLQEGAELNLERAMKVGDRLGGHIVSGHVDGTGIIESIGKHADGWDVRLSLSKALSRYVIHKGSICLDGISLTVNALDDREHDSVIRLMLIPTTVGLTSFKSLSPGQVVNVEVDTVGKFIERLTLMRFAEIND